MKIYLDNCCYNRPFDDQTQERIHLESEVLEPVGMVRFMQQFDLGHGDYTKDKQNEPDEDFDEIDALLKR